MRSSAASGQIDSARLFLIERWSFRNLAHPVSLRPCYRGVVEHSVYVDDEWQGRGIGRALLERLFESTEQDGIWTIQTGVFPENEASLALHEKCGFRVVGTQERLGKLDGVWRDVVVLERRSKVIS